MKAEVSLLFACTIILIPLPAACGRVDAGTRRIRLLFVGQWPYGGRPQYLIEDPLLMTSVVPYHDFGAQLDQIQRYMHQRYPRTLQHMTDNYDAIAFSNIQLLAFTSKQIQMVTDSVTQKGLGYAMSGGHTSFGGTTDQYPSWAITSIDQIFPVEVVEGLYIRPIVFKLTVSDPADPLMASLPWRELPLFTYTLNAVNMRPGGRLLAEANLKERWPVLAYGDFEAGRSLVFMTPLNVIDNSNMKNWGYFDDMCANMMYFVAGVELPRDAAMVHELRGHFRTYHDQRLLYLSMVEFVDRFGANTAKLEDLLEEIEAVRGESYSAYILQDYQRSAELMDQVLEEVKAGREKAIDVKNAVLLWVYVIEWISVTATLMITGSLLWALMVRRRLYREMGTTRYAL